MKTTSQNDVLAMELTIRQEFLDKIADYDKEQLLQLIEQFARESTFKTYLINDLVRAYVNAKDLR